MTDSLAADLDRELTAMTEAMDRQRSRAKTAESVVQALQAERDSLEKDLTDARETIAAVRKRAEHAEARLSEAEAEIARWKEAALTIQANLPASLRVEWLRGHTEGFEDNGKALDLVVTERDQLKARVAELERERDEARKDAADWKEIGEGNAKEVDAALAHVAELERLLAHARETAAANLEDKRIVQARCAELEKKQKLAATDAFRVGQAYHEQSQRMRDAEVRCKELEGALRKILDHVWQYCCRADLGTACHEHANLVADARAALDGAGTTESDLGGQGSPVQSHGDNPDPAVEPRSVGGGHDRSGESPETGNVAEPQLGPDSAPCAESLPSISGPQRTAASSSRSCAQHPGCLEEPTVEVISFYCWKHNPFPPHPDHPFGPVQAPPAGNGWQLDGVYQQCVDTPPAPSTKEGTKP